MVKLTHKQEIKLALGKRERDSFRKSVSRAIKSSKDKISHAYFYGPAGIGKTYEVEAAMEDAGYHYIVTSGNASMFGFGVRLATLAYTMPNQKIVINVDDCDEILKDGTNCNIMKNVLAGAKVYDYMKNMTSQMGNLSEIQIEAIEHFSDPTRMGFVVPTHNFQFIITSNLKLPNDDQVTEARKKGQAKAQLMAHRNAIGSRCNPWIDLDLDRDTHWGWLADIALTSNTDDLGQLTGEQKIIILDWVDNNWDDLKERSVRTLNKLAKEMLFDPADYRDVWESRQFLK